MIASCENRDNRQSGGLLFHNGRESVLVTVTIACIENPAANVAQAPPLHGNNDIYQLDGI